MKPGIVDEETLQQQRELCDAAQTVLADRAREVQTLQDLRELCDAAQAVLDGKARHVDSAGDRYVIDQTLVRLEAVLLRVRR